MKLKKKRKYFKKMWDRIIKDINLDDLISENGLIESEKGESYLCRHLMRVAYMDNSTQQIPRKQTNFTARIEFNVEETETYSVEGINIITKDKAGGIIDPILLLENRNKCLKDPLIKFMTDIEQNQIKDELKANKKAIEILKKHWR